MTFLVLLLLASNWTVATPGDVISGLATYMNPGKIEGAAAYHGYTLEPGMAGFVALNRAGDKGRLVWLEYEGQITGPYLVVDCAQRGEHYKQRIQQHRVVEVGWKTAKKWGIRKPVQVRVWLSPPTEDLYYRYTRKAD